MTKFLLLIMMCCSGVALATPLTNAKTQQQVDDFNQQIDRVVFIDSSLHRYEINRWPLPNREVVKVTAEKYGAKRSDTGTLKAWVVLKNRTAYDLQLEARVTFLDDQLVPIDGDTSQWERLYLAAGSIGTFKNASLSFDARHFMIEIREGR